MADQDWFAALYRSSYRRLVLAVYALTNDLGEAEEITQEAFAVAYGRQDAGRTWSVSTLPAVPATGFSLTTGGHALYLTAYGGLPDLDLAHRVGLLAIFRSTDGGASWQQTWQAKDGVEPRASNGVPIAARGWAARGVRR